ARPQPGEVRPGARLTEQLAPHLVAAQQRREVPLLLRFGSVRDKRRPDHPDADGKRARVDVEARLLPSEDTRFGRCAAASAVLRRPRDPGPALVEQGALPLLAVTHVLGVGRGARVPEEPEAREVVLPGTPRPRVRLEERPRPSPERGGGILRGVALRHPRAARSTSARRNGTSPRRRTRARGPTPLRRPP